MEWGDKSFTSDVVADYVGSTSGYKYQSSEEPMDEAIVQAAHVDLHRRYVSYARANTSTDRLAAAEALQIELIKQQAAEVVYRTLAERAYPGNESKQQEVRRLLEPPDFPECELSAHAAIRDHCASQFDANSGFALQFHQVVVNICADVARGLNLDVPNIAKLSCSASERRADTLVV